MGARHWQGGHQHLPVVVTGYSVGNSRRYPPCPQPESELSPPEICDDVVNGECDFSGVTTIKFPNGFVAK